MARKANKTRFRHDFWEAPYRPMFSASIGCALLSIAWWPLGVGLGLPAPGFESVTLWHIHELVFGFAAAAIGGYLLTALPAWTGNPPIQGLALKVLFSLWLIARLAMALADHIPNTALILLNTGYFFLLAGIIGHQLLSKSVYYKLGLLLAPIGLGLGEVLFLRAALSGSYEINIAIIHTLLIGLVLLMASIGMRAIPAFTSNWFAQRGREIPVHLASANLRAVAQGLLGLAMLLFIVGQQGLACIAMISSALALFWIMRRWHSLAALANPLLAAQHLAFVWLPVGLILIGLTGLAPAIYPTSDAWHAITIGGMSGLIMAISGRAASHTETGEMQANPGFKIGFSTVWVATWIRLTSPVCPEMPLITLASVLWCVAWVAFAVGYMPALRGPLRRPVLSGRRHESQYSAN